MLIDLATGETRSTWKEYLCATAGGTFANTMILVTTAILSTSLTAEDYCEHHRGSWVFVCLSAGVTGIFAFQRFKHHCGKEQSNHTLINTFSLMVNTAISVTCLILAIQAESC